MRFLKAIINKFDMFGAPVSAFNLDGRTKVKSPIGALTSIIIASLTLLFGLTKLEHLFARKNQKRNF